MQLGNILRRCLPGPGPDRGQYCPGSPPGWTLQAPCLPIEPLGRKLPHSVHSLLDHHLLAGRFLDPQRHVGRLWQGVVGYHGRGFLSRLVDGSGSGTDFAQLTRLRFRR